MTHPATPPPAPDAGLSHLLASLGQVIQQARQRAMQAVDVVQVQTCWELGRHIVEFEQAGQARAVYGQRLLPTMAQNLTAQFGKGFVERNLRHMRAFYGAGPIRNALRTEFSWTHYRLLVRLDNPKLNAAC